MRVPTLDGQRVDSREAPVVRPFANPAGTQGQAVVQGVEQLGRGVAAWGRELGQQVQEGYERQTRAAVAGAEGAYQTEINTVMDDPESGFSQTRGTASYAAVDPTLKALEDKRQAILKGLPSADARERFGLQSKQMYEGARLRTMRHVSGQEEQVAQANLAASESAGLDAVANTFADPEARVQALSVPLKNIEALGLSPEDVTRRQLDLVKKADKVVLERYLLAGDVKGAQDYFATAADRLGADAAPIRKRLEVENRALVASTESARLVKEATVEGTPWVDPAKAYEKAAELPEGPDKEAIVKELGERVNRAEALKKRAGEEALNEMYSILQQNGTTNNQRGREVREWMQDKRNGAADLLNRFDRQQEVDRRAARYQDADLRRMLAEQDKEAIAQFRSLDVDERAELDPMAAYTGRASNAAIYEMVRLKKLAVKEMETQGAMPQKEFSTTVDSFLNENGIRNKNDRSRLKAEFNDWRTQYLDDHDGKPPPRADVLKFKNELLSPVTVKRFLGLGTTQKPKFQVPPEDRPPADAPAQPAAPPAAGTVPTSPKVAPTTQGGVPAEDRAAITAALRKRGRPVTDAEVERLYQAGQQQRGR